MLLALEGVTIVRGTSTCSAWRGSSAASAFAARPQAQSKHDSQHTQERARIIPIESSSIPQNGSTDPSREPVFRNQAHFGGLFGVNPANAGPGGDGQQPHSAPACLKVCLNTRIRGETRPRRSAYSSRNQACERALR